MKIWKLQSTECRQTYEDEVKQATVTCEGNWSVLEEAICHAAERVCGRTSGHRGRERQTWSWNDDVQDTIRRKRHAFKKWQRSGFQQNKTVHKSLSRQTKREVAAAKAMAWTEWSDDLHTNKGQQKMFKVNI